jgi:two-component system nitrate/nitrite sensor histidine kinase NarX
VANQEASSPQFPERLSRRLSLAQVLILVAVLIAGGLAVFLAARIYHANTLIRQEYTHALAVDQVHLTFHAVVSEIELLVLTKDADRLQRIGALQEALSQKLATVLAQKVGEPVPTDPAREAELLGQLQRLVNDLGNLTDRLASDHGAGRLLATDIASLRALSERGASAAGELVGVHQEGVRQLLADGQKRLRLIIILYLALLAAGVGVIGVAGLVGKHWVTTPLRRLAEAARSVAEGRLDVRVPVATRDEVGLVSHVFNIMSESLAVRERELQGAHERLQRKLHEMEFLNRIGMQMLDQSGVNERDTILRSIADGARTLLSVDASMISLATTDSNTLVIHSTSGMDDAFQRKAGVVPCSNACDGGVSSTISECPIWRPGFARTHFAFPLQRGAEPRGVLCVATREERTLSADQRELLTALAAQAAITVEQSRLDAEVKRLAALEERGRIAREIHDGFAQTVSLLHLRIRQAQAVVSPEHSASLDTALEEIAALSGDMYEEIRRSISHLRNPTSLDAGFVRVLSDFLKEFSAQSRLPVTLEASETVPVRLAPASESQIIRIVQEALNNVRKHAQVDRARVGVERREGWLCVSVRDDGRGFDPARSNKQGGVHFGLQTMRERAESLGGTLAIDTAPGCGTRITATVPLESTQ